MIMIMKTSTSTIKSTSKRAGTRTQIYMILIVMLLIGTMAAGCTSKVEDVSQLSSTSSTSTETSNEASTTVAKPQGRGAMGKGQAVDTSGIATKWLDVAYADRSEAQKLDIYLPNEGEGPFPVIVMIHGGAFKSGDKSGELGALTTALERGYAVASVNYRLSSEAIFPAQINDIKAAIRFLRAEADQYQLDGSKIATWGGSAGGSLAALAATSGGVSALQDDSLGNSDVSDAVQAGIDWFGPISFDTMDAEFAALGQTPAMGATSAESSPESAYIGQTVGTQEAEALVRSASATTYITEDDPAMYIQHGTEDRNIPITQSENFAKALTEALGAEKVIFEIIEGAGHGGNAFNTPENLSKIFDFLDKALKGGA